jgi:hypothetical protein
VDIVGIGDLLRVVDVLRIIRAPPVVVIIGTRGRIRDGEDGPIRRIPRKRIPRHVRRMRMRWWRRRRRRRRKDENDYFHRRRSDVPRHAVVLRRRPSIAMLAVAFVASVAYAPRCSILGEGRGRSEEPRRHHGNVDDVDDHDERHRHRRGRGRGGEDGKTTNDDDADDDIDDHAMRMLPIVLDERYAKNLHRNNEQHVA